jgi:hypothetical protein
LPNSQNYWEERENSELQASPFSIPFTSRVLPNRHHRITNIWNFLFPLPISRYNVIQLFIQVGLVFGGQQQQRASGEREWASWRNAASAVASTTNFNQCNGKYQFSHFFERR